jgi:hypothetical protein
VSRRDLGTAGAITAFALVLRLLGIAFGLPYFHHWDEGWVTGNTTHMLQTPDWQPWVYEYGAPLSTLMALTVRAMTRLWPTSLFDPNDGFLMHLVGRYWTAGISASGALATFFAARWSLAGERGSFVRATYAALAYATCAELVSHGRYAVTDACLVALVAWTLAVGARYLRGRRVGWALGAVACAALVPAFKITGAPAMLVPAVLLAWRPPAASRRVVWAVRVAAVPLALAVFVALNPHFVLHFHKAMSDVSARVHQYEEGRVPEFLVRRRGPEHLLAIGYLLTFYVFHRWRIASAVMAGAAALGLARAVRLRSLPCIAGAAHAAAVVLGLAITSRAFLARNYLVVVPVACIGFGFAVEWVVTARARLRWPVAAAFAAVYVVVPFVQAVRNQQLATDTRIRAMDWLAEHRGGAARVTVACTPGVARDASADDRGDLRGALARPAIVFLPDVHSAADVTSVRPDYVLDVSQPDMYGRGDSWLFSSVRGYREVARFDANPYEHNFAVTPTWMGRFDVVVLRRQPARK